MVNDASSDKAQEKILDFISNHTGKINFIDNPVNRGKGYCIRAGVAIATGDYVIMQDADLELNPGDINLLLKKVADANADVVYGSRFAGKQHAAIPLLTKAANKFLTGLTRLVTFRKITDMETCYKLVRTSIIKNINLKENRFGFEPEITVKLLKTKITFYEVPITYLPRTSKQGKKIGWKDGFRAVICILRYRLFE